VASCSFGTSNFDAQTNQVYNPAEGVNDRSSTMDVLDALIVSDEDGRGRFIAGLVNNSHSTDDALISVAGSGKDAAIKGSLATPIDVVPDGYVQLAADGVEPVVLEGDPIVAGTFVEVTVSFNQADAVTLQLPVVTAEDDFAGITVPSAGASS
jgi:hypothetical protein